MRAIILYVLGARTSKREKAPDSKTLKEELPTQIGFASDAVQGRMCVSKLISV